MNEAWFEENKKEFLAEIKVGVKNFGIPIDEAVAKFNRFIAFIEEIGDKYDIKEFICNIGGKGVEYKSNNFIVAENKFKIDLGIIHEEKIISVRDIAKEYKKVFELVEIKKVAYELNDSLSLEGLHDKKDFWKMVKKTLKAEGGFILSYAGIDTINTFIKKFYGGEIKKEDLKLNKIGKVFEKENTRFAVINTPNDFRFILAIPDFQFYNYLDEGRGFFFNYDTSFILDYDTPPEDLDILDTLKIDLDEDIVYLDSEKYKTLISKEKNKKRIEELKEKQEQDIGEQIDKVFNKKGQIILNGITRYKEGFLEYQNNKIGFKGFAVLGIDKEEKDFNNIFGEVVRKFIWDNGGNKCSFLYCGNFKIKMQRKKERWYIDNIRINGGERVEVLEKALCYEKKKDYNKFLEEVSKCSIRIHNVLSSGLRYNLTDRYADDKIYTKLKCIRKKGKHYLSYNNKSYRISNIGYLISGQNYAHKKLNTHILAETLANHTQLDYDKAISCIAQGLKEYREGIKRAKELLNETIKKLDITSIEIENSEYTGKGYLVKGNSGKQYFISENQKVYQYPQMRYICIINKGRVDNLNSVDLLISRLYACKNDDVLKKEISTL